MHPKDQQFESTDSKITDWKPRATEGAVPKRVDKYKFSPLALPTKPDFARDPKIIAMGDELFERIKTDAKQGNLTNPWRRATEWQKHPYFSSGHKFRLAFPGFGIAVVAFISYLGLDYVGIIPKSDNHGGGKDHH